MSYFVRLSGVVSNRKRIRVQVLFDSCLYSPLVCTLIKQSHEFLPMDSHYYSWKHPFDFSTAVYGLARNTSLLFILVRLLCWYQCLAPCLSREITGLNTWLKKTVIAGEHRLAKY